jgi:hypothetical protein
MNSLQDVPQMNARRAAYSCTARLSPVCAGDPPQDITGVRARPERNADNLTAICQLTV